MQSSHPSRSSLRNLDLVLEGHSGSEGSVCPKDRFRRFGRRFWHPQTRLLRFSWPLIVGVLECDLSC